MPTENPVGAHVTADELEEAFGEFASTVSGIATSRNWDRFADLFTPDAVYVEHAMGTMHGRAEIGEWIVRTMTTFPGSHMTSFDPQWHVVDPPTARVICEIDNPMRDPGDGSVITATNITILTYAGDGLWRCEEDVYNPLEFGVAAMRWCQKAQALGTLDEAANTWMQTTGRAFGRVR